MKKTESRIGSSKEVGEVFEKPAELTVVFGKCVEVDHIESANVKNVFTFNQVLPFSLQDFDSGYRMPSMFFHVLQNIRMRFDNDMLRWTVSERLKEGIYLWMLQSV